MCSRACGRTEDDVVRFYRADGTHNICARTVHEHGVDPDFVWCPVISVPIRSPFRVLPPFQIRASFVEIPIIQAPYLTLVDETFRAVSRKDFVCRDLDYGWLYG